ncbi:hypothetical protein Ddye_028495 [Dipteronia dyeriana]|uniref:J domain-containing protein n=1 Tax=Dipteronia dyeriana TaxID=168575 RepID=A0AAD9TR43_9ROSI|nr:hypothetical protein Ddye_028495 [Dipteronia dyeriana]
MECNKEEAVRAKEIAEKRMQDGDFSGAQKIARKAQQLFPGLDNVSQLLTVCEVHCAAQDKMLGSDKNWYTILQIERSADEMTIKKQYRKLALMLHPDKNKYPGAEAAFKLIGEANRVLSDKGKRSVYDLKFRTTAGTFAPKPQPQQSQRNSFKKQGATSNFQNGPHSRHGAATNVPKPPHMQFPGAHPSQNADKATFWTLCASCGIRYQYHRTHVNKVLRCQSCQQSFTAYDLGSRGISPGHPWNRSLNQNGVPNPVFQNGCPNPGPSTVPSQSNRGKPSAMAQEKVDGRMKGKEGVRMRKPVVSNGTEGVGKPKPDGGKPREFGTSRSADKKRKRKSEGESSESYEDEDGLNTGHPTRRSSRQKHNVSYSENKNEEDDFVNPPNWSNGSKPSDASEEEVKELDPELLKYPDPEFSDFDKDRAESCFAVNQVWAIYDTCDGMPRYYARIKKVFSPGFKLQITWLEPDPDDEGENDWCDVDLPVACGKFTNGKSEGNEDLLMFSHQVSFIRGAGRNSCLIYPKRGETWALFRDWDIKWSDNPEEHQPPYEYDFVEVLTDFKANVGIGVAYLGKVKGFVGVFQRIAKNGVLSFNIVPGELYRFSHRIPSFRMTGKERDGVPEGSFELDPASLPHDKPSDVGDHKLENRKVDTEPSGSCPRSSQGNMKSKLDSMKSSTPKKHESDPNRENSERRKHNKVEASVCTRKDSKEDIRKYYFPSQPKGSTTYPADERTRAPMKHEEVNFAMDALRLRKSPRDLSKKSNQVNASQPTTWEDANKHLDAKENEKHNSVPQSKESASPGVSDGKMHLPVRNGSSTNVMETSDSPALSTTSRPVAEAEFYDFKQDKSEEKFELAQIWALYSDSDAMPKSYAQVKVIDSTPDFRLHVALLEASSPPKDASRPVCCGTFKLKNGKLKVLPRSAFSHQLKVKPVGRNRFEVYPQKGQVWALYRNWNSESTFSDRDKGECEIVEVLEDSDQCIKVAVLMRINGAKVLYRVPRSQRSKAGFMEIQQDDVTRFSHQIPALQLTGEKENQFRGYWNLDPMAIPGTVICLE